MTRYRSVDALRGLAAAAVVFTHVPRETQSGWRFFAFLPLDFGVLGVPLFLVLSGFCIHLGVARRAAAGGPLRTDWFAFWRRRFVRLYPPYVVALVLSVAVAYFVPTSHPLPGAAARPWDVFTHLTLVHNLTNEFHATAGNPAFWTLGLEEQLYALFAVVLALRQRMPMGRVVVIGLAASVGWKVLVAAGGFALVKAGVPRADHVVPVGPFALGNWAGWPFGYWVLWLLGAWAAEAHVGLVRLPDWAYRRRWAAAAAAVCLVTHFRTLGRYAKFWLTDDGPQGWARAGCECLGGLADPAFGLAAFIVLNRWVRAEAAGRFGGAWVRPAAAVGAMSYSLYLVHMPVIDVLKWAADGHAPGVLYPAACLAAGFAFFFAVERHFLSARPAPAAAPREPELAPR